MSRIRSKALIALFCAVAGGGLIPLWSGSWMSVGQSTTTGAAFAAEAAPALPAKPTPPPAAAPGSAAVSSYVPPPPALLDQARQLFPAGRAFDPLDLTAERIRVLEQAFQLVMTLRARDLEITAREQALDAARLELEARIRIFETEIAAARDGYRQSVREEFAERERAAEAKLTLAKQQEDALVRIKSQLRRDVGEQFDKIVAAYQAMKPKRAARVLEEKDPADVAAIMFLLPDDQRARIFSEMDPGLVGSVLKGPFAEELGAARQGRNGRAVQRQ